MSRDGGPGTDRKGVHSVLLAAAWGRPDEQGLATSALAVGLASLGSVDVVVVGGAQGAASVDARLRLFGSPPSGLPQPVPSVVMAALRATALPPDAAREPARRWRRPASCARFVDELPVAAWRESGKFARMLEPDVVVVAGESGPAGVEAVAAAGEVGLVACAPLLDLPVPLPHTDEHVLLEVADVVLASSSVEAAAVETLVPRLDARNLVLLGSCLPAEPVSVVPFPRVVPPGLDPKAREPVLAEAPDVVVLAHDPFPGPDPGAAHPLRRSDERAAVRAGWLASVLANRSVAVVAGPSVTLYSRGRPQAAAGLRSRTQLDRLVADTSVLVDLSPGTFVGRATLAALSSGTAVLCPPVEPVASYVRLSEGGATFSSSLEMLDFASALLQQGLTPRLSSSAREWASALYGDASAFADRLATALALTAAAR